MPGHCLPRHAGSAVGHGHGRDSTLQLHLGRTGRRYPVGYQHVRRLGYRYYPGENTFTVTVTDANGSVVSATVGITVNTYSASISPASPTPSCANPTVTLTASEGASYQWSTGSTDSAITVSSSGPYSVTVTGTNGCSASATTTVTGNTVPPTAGLVASGSVSCSVSSATLTASGGSSYIFSGPGLVSSDAASGTAVVNVAGTYSVTATTGSCSSTAMVTVRGSTSAPNASLTNDGPLSCAKPSVTLTASGGVTYQFEPSITASGASATVTTARIYSVIVTGANGCTSVASTTVADASQPVTITGQSASVSLTAGQTARFSASGTGLSYQWQLDAGSGFFNPSNDATYSGVNSATLSVANTTTALSLIKIDY